MKMQNGLVLQAGGPTSVINSSLAAVMAHYGTGGGRLFGARFGLQGFVDHDWVELTNAPAAVIERLRTQPAAALGSGRFHPDDEQLKHALTALREQEIGKLFLIGGNGTMGAARQLVDFAPWLRVVGIPKTIDNDLAGTDVSPGYASAARYLAMTVRDAWLDLRAMANFDDVTIVETMGRHCGWLAASTALAQLGREDAPHIVLLPEAPADEDAVLQRISRVHEGLGVCLVVVAEGARDAAGHYLAEKMGSGGVDGRGQVVLSMAAGAAAYLASRVQLDLGLRCRQVRLNSVQRTCTSVVSALDRELAWAAGAAAVDFARSGRTGIMVGLRRKGDKWACEPTPLAEVVGVTWALPASMVEPASFGVTAAFAEYAAPLVGPLHLEAVLWT